MVAIMVKTMEGVQAAGAARIVAAKGLLERFRGMAMLVVPIQVGAPLERLGCATRVQAADRGVLLGAIA